jgi:rhamnogalacturonan endolyase
MAGYGLMSSVRFVATTAGSTLTVDTDGGLVFQLSTATGDIISMVYGGKELQSSAAKNTFVSPLACLPLALMSVRAATVADAFPSPSFSHIASGFGQASVTSNVSGSTILVTVTSSNISPGEISQYYAVKKGDPTIYMLTSFPLPSIHFLLHPLASSTSFMV